MPEFPTPANCIYWVRSLLSGNAVQMQRTVSQFMFQFAIAFAIIAMPGLLGSSPIAEAASCGAKNQRPCSIFERIPSCNKGLYEDFKKGRCLSKVVPGRDCGRNNQRPCKLWERIPSCNSGLVEDFKKGRCVTKVVPGRDCGRANQRPCTVVERIPSCNSGLVEDFKKGRCVVKAIPGKDCGNANQRPCKVWERIPSCNDNLKEDFAKGICVALPCGKKNGRPCTIVERIPSCDKGLVEHFPSNQCTTLADLGNKFKCGKRYQKPCKLLERIPSCDSGLVEDFLKGKCVPSPDAERHRIAGEKLKQIGGFVASKVGFATQVANNPQVRKSLNSKDKTSVARVLNPSGVGETQMPDGYLLRTMTVGVTAGAKIFVGASGGAGAAIDLKGERPAYAYATGDYSVSLGVAAGGGIDVGFWVCQNNKIGGDSWGVEFGVGDVISAFKKADFLKKGPSLGIGLWFDYSKPPVFQGFTISPEFGIGPDFGGVVKAATAVEDDPSVECDGRPKRGANRQFKGAVTKPSPSPGFKGQLKGAVTKPNPTPGFKGQLKGPIPQPRPNLAPKTVSQQINYGGGIIRQQMMSKKASRPDLVRICLRNYTGQPKAIKPSVRGMKPLNAPTNRSISCANFSAKLRLSLKFLDRGIRKKPDVMTLRMNLQHFAGDMVVFEWYRDN